MALVKHHVLEGLNLQQIAIDAHQYVYRPRLRPRSHALGFAEVIVYQPDRTYT